MADYVVTGILLIIVGAAIAYIIKAKRSGTKCIGCPAGGNCSSKGGGHCNCGCHADTQE